MALIEGSHSISKPAKQYDVSPYLSKEKKNEVDTDLELRGA